MSDYIKREDALNASKLVYIECIEKDDGGFLEVDADNIPIVLKRDIMELPAADVVERKHGEWGYRWKVHGDGRRPTELFPCSECGYENTSATNFCPNCGADMREANDEKA